MAARVAAEVAYPGHFRCGGEFLALGRWVRGWDFKPSVLDCSQEWFL